LVSIAVFASGKGTNFDHIAQYFASSGIGVVKLLIFDQKDAPCTLLAEKRNIPTVFIDYKTSGKENAELHILEIIQKEKIQLCVLAGFMRILSQSFIQHSGIPVINIHPSLLPEYKGINSIARAYNGNTTYTGITIHFVNERIDDGEIIFQKSILIDRTKTVDDLEKLIHHIEYENYPVVIEKICRTIEKKGDNNGKLSITR